MSRFTLPTNDQFTATEFATENDKRLTVRAAVLFLEDFDEKKFTKRAYEFFSQTLSMIAYYDQFGFYSTHFADEYAIQEFLAEVRSRVDVYARLDAKRGADMAKLFSADHNGPYAALLNK